MKAIKQTYIAYIYSTELYREDSIRKVKTRDVSMIKIPKNICGFGFFDIISATATINGKKVRIKSKRINISPTYYCGGKVYTLAELKRKFPNEEETICNIEEDKCKKIIICSDGAWREFEDNDVVLKKLSLRLS
jgi:uncharacterized protein (UPF0128 family)